MRTTKPLQQTAAPTPQQQLERQPLGKVGLIVFIAFLTVFPPIATDMYMPSMPEMRTELATTTGMGSMTITAFFLFFGIGQLLFGTLSDKYGRKPILMLGLVLFAAANLGCALAPNIWLLLLWRMVSGIGGGAAGAVGTALVKDCFENRMRERVLVITQAGHALAPVVAPIIGGWIATFATWRTTFWVLTAIGAGCVAMALFYKESNPVQLRFTGTLIGSLGRMAAVAKNKGFSVFLLVLSILNAPFMGYVTMSSYVYMDGFGMSSATYSLFFAGASLFFVAAPFVYLAISRYVPIRKLVSFTIVLGLVAGVVLMLAGYSSPWIFFACIAVFLTMESTIRPGTTNILLSQQEGDTGSASSLINFAYTVFGLAGTMFALPEWGNLVFANGVCILAFCVIAGALWIYMLRSKIRIRGVE